MFYMGSSISLPLLLCSGTGMGQKSEDTKRHVTLHHEAPNSDSRCRTMIPCSGLWRAEIQIERNLLSFLIWQRL